MVHSLEIKLPLQLVGMTRPARARGVIPESL